MPPRKTRVKKEIDSRFYKPPRLLLISGVAAGYNIRLYSLLNWVTLSPTLRGRIGRPLVFSQHQALRFIKTQLLMVLQGTHAGNALEMPVQKQKPTCERAGQDHSMRMALSRLFLSQKYFDYLVVFAPCI